MSELIEMTRRFPCYDPGKLLKHLSAIVIAVVSFTACSVSEDEVYEIIIKKDSQEFVYSLPYQEIISSQTATERIWKEADVQLVRNHSDGIFTPVRIIMNNSSTFVLDASDGYIKQVDHESYTMRRIGQGKGNGPGEFMYPFDFDINPAGSFVVMDIAKRALITLDSKGKPLRMFQFGGASPTTLTAIDNNRVIVMINGRLDESHSGSDGLFQIYNRETNELRLFNDFLSDTEHLLPLSGLEMAFTGTLLNDEGHVIFLPKNINHIIRMKENGEIAYARKTFDNAALPRIESSTNGNVISGSLTGESATTSLDGFLLGDEIAVWSKTGIDMHGGHVIDFYESSTGDFKNTP